MIEIGPNLAAVLNGVGGILGLAIIMYFVFRSR